MVKREVKQNIVHYVVGDASRKTFEAWATMVREDTANWPLDQPYPALHDFREISALTPTLRHHALDVVRYGADFDIPGIYVAVLFRPNLGFKIGEFFLNRELNRIDDNLHFKAFTDYDQAVAWLVANLDSQHKDGVSEEEEA